MPFRSPNLSPRALCAGVLLLALAGCGGGDPTSPPAPPPPPPPPPPPAAVATVDLTPTASTLRVSHTRQLSATPRDQAGNALSDRPVSWTSSASSVASVSGSGLVTAVAPGTATISAASEGRSANATITVTLVPVTAVAVSPAAVTRLVGQTVTLSAALADSSGAPITGRTVSWASGNGTVATVSATGVVTALTAGTATITATVEGVSAGATVTVLEPVATVVLTGASRVKVGDSYSYSVTARLADGTVVARPVSWAVLEPGRGVISSAGVLTPLQAGSLTILVSIDGTVWSAVNTAYDWLEANSDGNRLLALSADVQVTNRFGVSEYPTLALGCGPSGHFFVWVSLDNFVTANGVVAYSFDSGTIFSAVWDELAPAYRTLWHPGPTNLQRKNFGQLIAQARLFGFAFNEFLADAEATFFRVTGLGARIGTLLAACPNNSLRLAPDDLERGRVAFPTAPGVQAAPSFDAARRAAAGPVDLTVPVFRWPVPRTDTTMMVRRGN